MDLIRTIWVYLLAFMTLFTIYSPHAAAGAEITGEAAVLVDCRNGQVLYEKNPHKKMYPASTTKTLTAIIAIESGRMSDMVTVPCEACNVEGSAIGLQEGERISLGDLVYALLLNSGNDSAVAIAWHLGGSVEGFARQMNKKAVELGALNTHFCNPHGLPDPHHYTTAYDMALIARYAMQNPEFKKIVSTRVKTIYRSIPEAQTYLGNSNRLLWNYDGAIGVKTGYTVDAGQCLVSAAVREGRELIAVVLKSEGAAIWSDSMGLLDHGFNDFYLLSLVDSGKFITDVQVNYGKQKTVPVQVNRSLSYNFSRNEPARVKQEIMLDEKITAPIKAGNKIGELVFFSGGKELGRADLLAGQDVKRNMLAQWGPWLLPVLGLFTIMASVRRYNYARRRRWAMYNNRKKYYI